MLSKRSYKGPPDWLLKLNAAFNHVRPGTARLIEERDGTRDLHVGGWPDYNAAAVVTLLRAHWPPEELSEELVELNAQEMANRFRLRGTHPGPELLGTVHMSDHGSLTPVVMEGAGEAEADEGLDEQTELLVEMSEAGVPLSLGEMTDPITGGMTPTVRATWLDTERGIEAPKELRQRSVQFTSKMVITLEIEGLNLHVLKMLAAHWDVEVPEATIRVLTRALKETLSKAGE